MQTTDLTIVILRGIREDVQSVRCEIRAAVEQLGELAASLRYLSPGADPSLRALLEDHERRIAALEARTR